MRRITITLLVSVFLFTALAKVHADAWSTFRAPYVVNEWWQKSQILDEHYDRYQYPYMAANYAIWVDKTYLPNDGDTWEIELRRADGVSAGVYTARYYASSDCISDNFGVLGCGVTQSALDGYVRYWNVYVYYATQCMEETGYVMTGSYNIAPIGVSPYAISPVDFRPAAPQVTMLDTRINPDIPPSQDYAPDGTAFPESLDPGLERGTAKMTLLVPDNLGCGEKLDDEWIQVKSYVVPGSGGPALHGRRKGNWRNLFS